MDYQQYTTLINNLLLKDQTTGNDQSDSMVAYTRLNQQRMKRLDKTIIISDDLQQAIKNLKKQYTWQILTEAWCGDAAQILPVINKVALAADGLIKLELLLRDEHPQLMDKHLTNGKKSIPKIIVSLTNSNEEVANWGPRPLLLQTEINLWRSNPNLSKEEWQKEVHAWYAKDKTHEIQKEMAGFIKLLE